MMKLKKSVGVRRHFKPRGVLRRLKTTVSSALDGLLTDETWGLRLKGGEAYSIIPCGVAHHIIAYPGTPHSFFDRKYAEYADASACRSPFACNDPAEHP